MIIWKLYQKWLQCYYWPCPYTVPIVTPIKWWQQLFKVDIVPPFSHTLSPDINNIIIIYYKDYLLIISIIVIIYNSNQLLLVLTFITFFLLIISAVIIINNKPNAEKQINNIKPYSLYIFSVSQLKLTGRTWCTQPLVFIEKYIPHPHASLLFSLFSSIFFRRSQSSSFSSLPR